MDRKANIWLVGLLKFPKAGRSIFGYPLESVN